MTITTLWMMAMQTRRMTQASLVATTMMWWRRHYSQMRCWSPPSVNIPPRSICQACCTATVLLASSPSSLHGRSCSSEITRHIILRQVTTRWTFKKSTPLTTFVDISAMREDFCSVRHLVNTHTPASLQRTFQALYLLHKALHSGRRHVTFCCSKQLNRTFLLSSLTWSSYGQVKCQLKTFLTMAHSDC